MNKILRRHKADSQRIVLMKRGTIFFRDTSIGCLVLNISTGVAGLVVESDSIRIRARDRERADPEALPRRLAPGAPARRDI
ncbi:hypothetical protein MTX20_04760 [Bradyrhizobium sp. ISRA435]|nr:hypothetical protein MTX20_04760 [Bradyrhizobium sp. ISRA435]